MVSGMISSKQTNITLNNNKTQIIGLCGSAQSGKSTSASYLAGLTWHTHRMVEKFKVDESGKLVIYDLNSHSFPEGKRFDCFHWDNDPEINQALERCLVHPANLVHRIAFGDILKEILQLMFGLDPNKLWGSDKDKAAETIYTVGQFRELLGVAKFPFKNKKDSEKLSYREMLQVFGTEVGRRISPTLWVDRSVERIYDIINQWRPALIVVDDVRIETELDAIKKMGGSTIALLRQVKTSAGVSHASEQTHKLFEKCDYAIKNQDMSINDQCIELFTIMQHISQKV